MPSHPTTITRPDWSGWRYDAADLKLRFHVSQVKSHEIELNRGSTSAAILDSLFKLENKTWATPKVLDGAARALKDLLNPLPISVATQRLAVSRPVMHYVARSPPISLPLT